MDVHTSAQRSCNMAAIRSKDTKPELVVRRLAHRLGYRFRLHRGDLPGRPDLVFPRLRKIIEVRGCFWHMHDCPFGRVVPKTNAEFWQAKRTATVARDARNEADLEQLGWDVLVIWECQTRDAADVWKRIRGFLVK